MARSSRIYVVLDGSTVVAAFTVKHELKTWWSKFGRSWWDVVSAGDGIQQGEPRQLPPGEYQGVE